MAKPAEETALAVLLYSLSALALSGGITALVVTFHNLHALPGILTKGAEFVTGLVIASSGVYATGKIAQQVINVVHDIRIQYTV